MVSVGGVRVPPGNCSSMNGHGIQCELVVIHVICNLGYHQTDCLVDHLLLTELLTTAVKFIKIPFYSGASLRTILGSL